MNNNIIICFDFETGGLDPTKCSPIELGAIAIHPRTLKPIPGAVFNSMMRPETQKEFDAIEDQALAVNKKTREQIKAAPLESLVWKDFVSFVRKFKNGWQNPIPAGQFIYGYDLIISERLCKKYGQWDKKRNQQDLWNNTLLDLKNFLFGWFENSDELPDYKQDTALDYFGIDKTGQEHSALTDCKNSAKLICKFLELQRNLAPRIKFKNSFKSALTSKTSEL